MSTYYPGDTISCKIGYGKLYYSTSTEHERTCNFDIVCVCEEGYLVLVPAYMFMKNSFELSKTDCKDYGAPIKFLGSAVHYVGDDHIVGLVHRMTGLQCIKCKEHHDFAEVNRLDENGHGVLICWNCRNYPSYIGRY